MPVGHIPMLDYFEGIRAGRWQDEVLPLRALRERDEDAYKAKKEGTTAVTVSGEFSYRSEAKMTAHTGILAVDIDRKDQAGDIAFDELAADKYTYALHRSLSGEGAVLYLKIEGKRHREAYAGAEIYLANKYGLMCDPSCKDPCRLRFVSFDPDLFLNENAALFKEYPPPVKAAPIAFYTQTDRDFSHIFEQIRARSINIAESYADFLRLGFAFARHFGEAGRSDFHFIASQSAKYSYQKCDKQYTACLRHSATAGTGIGYFINACKAAGIEVKTPRTERIEQVVSVRRAMVGKPSGLASKEAAIQDAKEFLSSEGIDGGDVDAVAETVFSVPAEAFKNEAGQLDPQAAATEWIRAQNFRFNEVTQATELNGEPCSDKELNSMFLNLNETLPQKKRITKELFHTILESDRVKRYHPFRDYFEQNKHLIPPEDAPCPVDALIDCIKFAEATTTEDAEFFRTLIGKWLISIVGSAFGTHSVLSLILVGKMGKGKTEFFRKLLPPDLRRYFAEVENGTPKDEELRWTQNLLLCDDELSTKTKKEAAVLRKILSKQHYDVRPVYARKTVRLTRYAVSCGTSNEWDVLNDLEGNRRFVPVNIRSIDQAAYNAIDKDALFMRLYDLYQKFGDQFLTEEEIERLEQATSRNQAPSKELEGFLSLFSPAEVDGERQPGMVEYLTNTEILSTIEELRKLRISSKTLGSALRKVGITPFSKKIGGVSVQVYAVIRRNLAPTL